MVTGRRYIDLGTVPRSDRVFGKNAKMSSFVKKVICGIAFYQKKKKKRRVFINRGTNLYA